jgi:hypothetical protein
MEDTAFERHYTITELAKLWSCGIETVRREVLRDLDGVMRLSGPSGKTSYKIPESVARRIHTRLITPRPRIQKVGTR